MVKNKKSPVIKATNSSSWSEFTQTRLKQSILWPSEQINILRSKFSAETRSALIKKHDDLKLASWFDVASGLIIGAITIDVPVTLLMMATTTIIYGNNFQSAQEFALTFASEAIKSIGISSLNFGLRNLMRKENNGNVVAGFIGGSLDRSLRQPSSSTTTMLIGALNAGTYELLRPEINSQQSFRNSISIYGLIEGIDSIICNAITGGEASLILKNIATSILLGVYLATCINKLTIPYGNSLTNPIISFKDKTLETFRFYTSNLNFPLESLLQTR